MSASRLLLLALLLGCSGENVDTSTADLVFDATCDPVEPDPVEPLRWRRHRALVRDLSQALDLSESELCLELGVSSCSMTHFVPLGGNDPFEPSMYTPVATPMATTPAVVDKIVLSACEERVRRDAEGDDGLFQAQHLTDMPIADTEVAASLIRTVFRRVHSRDPFPSEVEAVLPLAEDRSGMEFATVSCFAIASTTETLLF